MIAKTAEKIEIVAETPQSKGEIAVFSPPRLPYHKAIEERFEIDRGAWKVLVEAIFPAAKTVDAVVMALSYCKSRNLDIFKRPVHVVPMWSSNLGRMVETVWPAISELRTTAFRTGNYGGKSATEFGPTIERTFTGTIERKNGPDDVRSVTVKFPEWGQVKMTRVLNGVQCAFYSPKVYWLEAYGRIGKTELPNDMWCKRPNGQLEKCVEAAGLRVAFPEEIGNEYAAEEMEGQHLIDPAANAKDVTPRDNEPPPPPMANTEPPAPPAAAPVAATAISPDDLLKFIETTLAAVTDADALANVWNDTIEPKLESAFPPDKDEAIAIYRRHETRLGID